MEKPLDLKMLGTAELGKKELINTNGGFILWFAAGLATTIFFDALLSGKESTDALMRGYQSTQ